MKKSKVNPVLNIGQKLKVKMQIREKLFLLKFALFFTVLLFSCKREYEEEMWTLPELKLAGLEKIPVNTSESKPVQFIFSCNINEERHYSVKIDKKVKQRGKNMPSMVADINIEMVMTEKLVSNQNDVCSIEVSFSEISVSAEPDIEQIKNDIVHTYSSLKFILSIDPYGKLVNIEKKGDSDIESINRILSDIKELRPSFPQRLLVTGDSWDSSHTISEPMPKDGKNIIKLTGVSTFKGFYRGSAVVIDEFKSIQHGTSTYGNILSDLKGEGIGMSYYLYNLDKKFITNIEYQNAEHIKIDFGNKGRNGSIEELVVSSVEVRMKNENE